MAVPVSLRVAGYDVSVSPSLSAAVEAWRGIAGVLGNSSQPASDTELSLVKKYSFAEETPKSSEQSLVEEAHSKTVNADLDAGLEASWVSSEQCPPPQCVAFYQRLCKQARVTISRRAIVSIGQQQWLRK